MAKQQNLFEYDNFFNLIAYGISYPIAEPIGFDSANISGSRDKDFFGFNYEFIDSDKLTLTFREGDGMEIVQSVYNLNGSDGKILFEYGFRHLGARNVEFLGTLNLNNYKVTDQGVSCSIEKILFDGKLRSRSETKINFNRTTDLDGNPVTPPPAMSIKMHSKKIVKNGRLESTFPVADMLEHFFQHNINWIQFDSTNVVKSEVDDLFSYPLSISTDDNSPISEKRFYFQPKEPGRMKINYSADFFVRGQVARAQEGSDNWTITSSIVVIRNKQVILNYQPSDATASGVLDGHKYINTRRVFNISTEFDLLKGDEVYCLTKITVLPSVSVLLYFIDTNSFSINIEQQTLVPPSIVKGYKLIDALKFVLQCATGMPDAIESRLFDVGGEAEKYFITNGFQLRNFSETRSVAASWRDLTEGLNPIFLLGMQFKNDKTISIDFAKKLFNTKTILNFTEVSEYEEEHEKSLVFNEIEIGYNKFAEDSANTLDDPHTNRILLTPITSYKAKYTQKTNLITSGYLIEQIRREQFKEAPSTSLSQDDDLFLISYVNESKYRGINFRFISFGIISLSRAVGMIKGDKFRVNTIGGLTGQNNGTLFTVLSRNNDYPEAYNISPGGVPENNFGDLEIVIDTPQAERNEAFSIVDGVISPETSINLRITPTRMLYNHSYILNSGFYNKLDTDLIQNTYTKSNGDLITQFNDTEPFKLLESNYVIKESENIPLSKFNKRERLCMPITATFKTHLIYEDLLKLKLSLTGTNQDPTLNYGVITFPDLKGYIWEGIVWAFNYEPTKELCQFTVRKVKRIR